MARILAIHIRYPEGDRCSGDLRLGNFLRLLAESNDVTLHVLHKGSDYVEAEENEKYRSLLSGSGIRVTHGSLSRELRNHDYDTVMVEFWYVARNVLDIIRTHRPAAKIVVDSEHVYFYSDLHKARVLGHDVESIEFRAKKAAELVVYDRADAVITVTREDRDVLLSELPDASIFVVPNIHEIPDLPPGAESRRVSGRIIFVGNFANNPSNIDSMKWFVNDIMPLVRAAVPFAHLQIVGNAPPAEVMSLAGSAVEVTGYVPDTSPYLLASEVSICPLRFGAGLKGKIGEAMMHRLPVVTTDIGAQGIEVTSGEGIMIGNSSEEFAKCVVDLLQSAELRQRVANGGFTYLERQYSLDAGRNHVREFLLGLENLKIKQLPVLSRMIMRASVVFEDYIGWRLR
jgi:glycosyltransferase involved in cell wall biosynthesis